MRGQRAAIYARFSSDLQNERSIDDQVALCQHYADRHGLIVSGIYDDRAVSGASTVQRLGWQRLMADAGARQFDIVLAEDIDRISRDEADYHAARKRLAFLAIEIHTAHGGAVSRIEGSIRAMMSAYFLENLAHKIRRGMAGRVRDGKIAGGKAYGYRSTDKPGEFAIVAAEADIIRRIFREFVDGASAREIAIRLNRDGIPSPRGSTWSASTIGGSRQRANGILANELYAGRMVWNRQHFVKDPDTGRRVARVNPRSEWQYAEMPQMAIVDRALFDAAQARFSGPRPIPTRHARHLLSGILKCAACGSGMVVRDRDRSGKTRVECSARAQGRPCTHGRTYYLADIEKVVVERLRVELRAPEMIRLFVRTYEAERRHLARTSDKSAAKRDRRVGEIGRELERLVDAIATGTAGARELSGRINALDAERAKLEREAGAAARRPAAVALHPGALERYLGQIERLAEELRPEGIRLEGTPAAAFREIVERVIVHPVPARTPLDIEIVGHLSRLTAPPEKPGRRTVWGNAGSGGGILTEPHTTFRLRFRAAA